MAVPNTQQNTLFYANVLGGIKFPNDDVAASVSPYVSTFEDQVAHAITWSGAFAGAGPTARLSKFHNRVWLEIPDSLVTTTSDAVLTGTAIPSRFRPTSDVFGTCIISVGGTTGVGSISVATTGVITIGRVELGGTGAAGDGTTVAQGMTAAANTGIKHATLCWHTAI